MRKEHDFSKAIRNPFAERLTDGYKVQVTKSDGESDKVVKEYFVTAEEVAQRRKRREEHLESMRVQQVQEE